MSNDHWVLLESLQQSLNKCSDLPPEIMLELADRLEEAISASANKPLQALSEQLIALFNKLLHLAPVPAADAAYGSALPDSDESAAYLLGQVSFAQLLASQTMLNRASDEFMAVMQDHRYEQYIKALAVKDCSGVDLAGLTGERTETVSRKLKDLRELGIADFYREGNKALNFLTPAAQAALPDTPTVILLETAAANDSEAPQPWVLPLSSARTQKLATFANARQNP
jgi:hypothetical protein